jgi:hypothetical protein
MKTNVISALFFIIFLSFLTSCASYKMQHYDKKEIEKINPDKYNVYIHDKNLTYQVGNPAFSPVGIKGSLNPIMDSATVAEIKHPKTHKQLKKHQHDFNVFTKAEIKDNPSGVILKKADITDITHLPIKPNIAEYVGTGLILALGVVVIIGVVYSFNSLL